MPPTITCYGAVGNIGGNKFLVEDGDARLFLDFGIDFGACGKYYNELLRPRPARGLLDPLALGLIPPLEGSTAGTSNGRGCGSGCAASPGTATWRAPAAARRWTRS